MKELLKKLNNEYIDVENNTPPVTFTTANERAYNNGLYEGQLKGLERVCQKVFGITGEELQNMDF